MINYPNILMGNISKVFQDEKHKECDNCFSPLWFTRANRKFKSSNELISFIIIIILPVIVFGQRNNNWYFSEGLGLSFDSSPPVVLSDGALTSFTEGVSTVSDEQGRLLFYTNGVTVWNKDHEVMDNGKDLRGYHHASQSALIVPFTIDSNKYFIFTASGLAFNDRGRPFSEYNYNVVDMSLNDQLGAVISKNNLLLQDVTEKQIAIKGDCYDWVITHQSINNKFYAFKIGNGIVYEPIISEIGTSHENDLNDPDNNGTTGEMTSSPNGNMIAVGSDLGILELFRFDKESGKLSAPIKLSTKFSDSIQYNINGLSFSPDGSKIYTGKGVLPFFNSGVALRIIDQYDVTQYDSSFIENSKTFISNVGGNRNITFDLTLGPDEKIYVNQDKTGYLGVINNPNFAGLDCDYDDKGLFLNNYDLEGNGLQNHVISPNPPRSLSLRILPEDQSLKDGMPLQLSLSGVGDSYLWNDGSSDPNYSIDSSGTYWVNVMNGNCTLTDTIVVLPEIIDMSLDSCSGILHEIVLCDGRDTTVILNDDVSNIMWSSGERSQSYEIQDTGLYYVSYELDQCKVTDSFHMIRIRAPSISLALPFSECADSNILVIGEFQQYDSIAWNTGHVGDALTIYESGEYSAIAYSGDCNVSRTVSIDLKEPVDFSIVRSQTSCDADSVTLSVDMNANQYLWNNGSSASEITVRRGAQYWVEIEIDGCMHRDSIMIESESKFSLGKDVSTCDQESVILSPLDLNADLYNWSTGETSSSIEVSSSGSYWLEAQLGECLLRDTIQVSFNFANALDLGDMILTCHTDPITLMSNIEGELYSWSTGEDTPIIEVNETGSYSLEVLTSEGCTYQDTIDIVFDELSVDLGADQEICIGDSTILSAPSPETLSSIVWSDGSEDPDLIVRSADSYWLAIERGMCLASDTIMISYGVCDMIPDSMMMDTMMIDTMTIDTMMPVVPGVSIPDDDCSVYIPNAISAGASQPINRFFQVFSNCALSSINIKIYDRWGNLHYQISDTVISDDDILIQPGVYVAKVEYRFEDGDEVEQVLQSVTVL